MTSEFELLERLYPRLAGDGPGVPLGVGDDAAVVDIGGAPVAVAVDAVIDGVHVDRSISSLADVGWKSVAVNVSDLAAIGAVPTAAVVALGRPAEVEAAEVDELYDGLLAAADRWEIAVVGGDVVAASALTVVVTVLGRVRPGGPLRRDAADIGHAVVVIGPLGLSAAGFACHRAGHHDVLEAHPGLLAAHRRPPAHVEAAGELLTAGATAAIDVSDGLGRDLGHIGERSGVAIEVQADLLPVPVGVRAAAEALGVDPLELVCGGGEDLALAATLPADAAGSLTRRVADATVVGRVVDGSGVRLTGPDRTPRDISSLGWEHGGSSGGEEAP